MSRLLPAKLRLHFIACLFLAVLFGWARLTLQEAFAQEEAAVPVAEAPADAPAAPPAQDTSLNLLNLYIQGGIFMHPILLLGVISLAAAIERLFGTRRARVMPEELVTALGQLGTSQGGFDPRKAFRICQQYPSAASQVIRAMLLQVGRPISEIQSAVQSSCDREATRLYYNVRWLNLAATTGTMIGLLGTIQGMILAFHRLTHLPPGGDKAVELSAGIYTALVTTFGGLCVAIPAVMMAHFFEGRIQTLFMEIEELVQSLLPQVERYEGRVRFSRQEAEGAVPEPPVPASTP
ncbi:MAG TPA: MotA/TolQ/ExbB proton channel family protein [Pirellulaceae bacterium]|nr:MotA/TolQ/ExbB proton channel family protein [Pirellulaceae bacterium]